MGRDPVPMSRPRRNGSHDPHLQTRHQEQGSDTGSSLQGHGTRSSVRRESATSPICRCRVIYMGSAVPHVTKDGLQGIQEPLRDLYPEQGLLLAQKTDSIGIDSWLSVWSNGILIENVDENGREVNKFFPIESLHYCAAVRYVVIPSSSAANDDKSHENEPNDPSRRMRDLGSGAKIKFLPLDSPFSRNSNITLHPPLFACILRRTTGIKVLECHAFICKRDQAANALVRCCFHAYADSMHAKQMEQEMFDSQSSYGTHTLQHAKQNGRKVEMTRRFSRSISDLDSVENKIEAWRQRSTEALNLDEAANNGEGNDGDESLSFPRRPSHPLDEEDDDNYKVWSGGQGMIGRTLPPQASASTPHLHRPYHALHPIPYLHPGHDGRATLRSVRTTASSHHQPLFRPPSVSSRSMINLMGPHHGPPHHHMPHHPHFPPPHMLPPLQALQPLPPFMPVPSTLSKKELKSLKSSMKKFKKKHKGALAPEFLMPGPPPPFLRHPMPMPFVVPPPMARGHHPPAGHPVHLHHMDEPIYVPAMRPLTPLSANSHYGPANGHFHPDPHSLPHSLGGPPLPPPPHAMRRDVSRNSQHEARHRESSSSRRNSQSNSRKQYSNSDAEPSDSSPFNTGIYRKKANLNERAFSYSIRQESRSRSNSLANVNYSPSQDPGSSGLINNEEAELASTNGRSNGQAYNRDAGIIAQSLESLHLNGNGAKINNHNRHVNGKSSMSSQSSLQSNSGMNGKTASIKRGSGPSHLSHHVNAGGSKPVPMPTIHSNGRNNHNH